MRVKNQTSTRNTVMPALYQLKISLLEPNPIRQLYRVLEVKGEVNFYELHQAIFHAFDREDEEHLWKFASLAPNVIL